MPFSPNSISMSNVVGERSVFILGAGATKAFAPLAPLVEDDYGLTRLLDHFRGFPHARLLLENEQRLRTNGHINVEQFMTRLHGRMPYDNDDARVQQAHLLSELTREFSRRVSLARVKNVLKEDLDGLARVILAHDVTCITFNYDDILDEALWEESDRRLHGLLEGQINKRGKKYWHPDGGYGFFIRPSELTVKDDLCFMDQTSMLLLKLHGSINWYPRSGEKQPYSIDAIYHHEDWYVSPRSPRFYPPNKDLIARHLEQDPFLIPPVLDKTTLGTEPVLKTVWSIAKDQLESTHNIYFIGYSMPATDLAGRFLFSETLGQKTHQIRVINLAKEENDREQIKIAYRRVFPTIEDTQFEFDGAIEWVKRICGQNATQGS